MGAAYFLKMTALVLFIVCELFYIGCRIDDLVWRIEKEQEDEVS